MAFPTIPTVAAGRVVTGTDTAGGATKTFPNLNLLTKNPGDLLIAIILEYDGNSTNAEFSSWGGGFTEFGDFATTTTLSIGCAYQWSDGTETGTFTVTTADTSTNDSGFILLSIPNAHPTLAPEAGGYLTGTNGAATSGSLDPAGWGTEDTLWITVGGCGETSVSGTFTGMGSSAPTSYTNFVSTGISADVVGGIDGAVAFRQLNAASEDPGNFSNDTSNARWGAITIAVAPGIVYTDSATVSNDLQASGSETAQFTDSQTIYNDLQSITTAEGIERTDSATAYLDLQSSGSDLIEYGDTAAVYMDTTASGADTAQYVDSQTVGLLLSPTGTDVGEYTESATGYVDLQPTSDESADTTDAETAYFDLQPSGVDTLEGSGPKQTTVGRVTFSDVNEPSYRTDHRLHVWASLANGAHTGYLGFQLYEGASAIGSELYTATLTGSEVEYVLNIADIDAQSIVDYTDLELAFVGYADTGDSAEFRIHDVQLEVPAAVPVERTDSGTIYIDLRPSTSDVAEFVDSAALYFDLQSSGTEVAVFVDSDTAYFDLQASGTETIISATQDADTAYFDLQASGTDTPVRTDAEQIYLDLDTFTIDIAEFVDGTTVKLLILPATTEERISFDSALVYFDLQAGSIILQVDFLLEIINCTARWVIEKPIKTRWQLLDLITRMVTETAVARWTIMETRRFKWKS